MKLDESDQWRISTDKKDVIKPRLFINYSKISITLSRWYSTGFRRRLCLCLLWPWPLTFWSQKLSAHLRTQIHLWPKLGEIPFIGFWDTVFTRFSGRTHALTHSQTDRLEYNISPASFFNGSRGVKTTVNDNKRLCYCRGTARRAMSVYYGRFLTELLTRSSVNA